MADQIRLRVASFRLSPVQVNALEALAKLWGVSRSIALRKIIDEAHAAHGPWPVKRTRKNKPAVG